MFRTQCVHHQEDHLYMQFLYGMFFIHLCEQSRKWQDVLGTEHTKVRVQLVFLMMNT